VSEKRWAGRHLDDPPFSYIISQGGGAESEFMTKADLIEGLANKLGMGKGEAERAVNIVLDDIINALKQGERVNISGFGTFSVSSRQARTGRNPKTGASIEISASRSAKFKPGKQLKDSLNVSETTPQPSPPPASE
jgi:DNA-binding protein HU-beta